MAFGNKGISLIEVAIGGALASVAIAVLMEMKNQQTRFTGYAAIKQDENNLRALLRSAIDCEKTFAGPPAACAVGGPITVMQPDGTPLIQAAAQPPYTTLGQYALRATCLGNQLSIQSARGVQSGGTFTGSADPLTREISEFRDLYDGIPILCGTGAGPGPGPGLGCFKVKQIFTGGGSGCDSSVKNVPSLCGIPGGLFRNGADGYLFQIEGSADQWSISHTLARIPGGSSSKGTACAPITLTASTYLKPSGKYEIPYDDVFCTGADNWRSVIVTVRLTALDAGGTAQGTSCRLVFRLVSPLVLDWANRGSIDHLDPARSHVRFDLDGDGTEEETGWILPPAAFLALDRNGNGRIDNGSELFGEGMQLSDGLQAPHGFAALAQFDGNGDGYVDEKDAIFPKLSLWTDWNSDGRTQEKELELVITLGIQRFSTGYRQINSRLGSPLLRNSVEYVGYFWGPKQCGQAGCALFDIFFSTVRGDTFP